jgi:hypothetical protein
MKPVELHMQLNRIFRTAGTALLLLTTACSVGGERIYNLTTYRTDPGGYLFADNQSANVIPTYISGNPFGGAPETLENVVGAALQSAYSSRDVTFATREVANMRRDMPLVVAFDPPVGTPATSLCRRPGRISWSPAGETVRVQMAFCFGDTPLVSIEGRIPRSSGVSDREFVTLIRDMLRRMFETGPMNLT